MGKAHGISGGGLEGRQTSHYVDRKTEPVSHPVSMNRPSMIGASTHFVKPPLYSSSVKTTTPFGTTPAECKPGGGRMILAHGSQSSNLPPRSMGKGRSLFR
jgi:hypothetical protein